MEPNRTTMRVVWAALWLWLSLCLFVSAQPLPALPNIAADGFAPPVRDQIRRAYNEAKARPRDAAAVGQLGMALHVYEEYQAAVECYERARRLAPQEFRWHYYAGIAQARLGRHDQAAAALQTALRRNAEYLPAQIKLAEALFELKKLAAAEALYTDATRKNPAAVFAWYGLGRVKAARQDVNAAINCWERAVTLAPHFGAAQYALALALRDAGRLGKAKEHLALYQQYGLVRPAPEDMLLAAITALNRSAQEYLNKGLALEADGDLAGSIAAHEKALEVNPNLPQAHINLMQLYGRTKQFDKAERHYRQATALQPNLADAHYNFGVLLASQQKWPEAAAAFARALDINPYYAEAHHNLGLLRLQQTRLDEAFEQFQAALASRPNYRAAHFELGRLLVHQGKLDEALAHFRQILTPEDHDTPRFLYALGATYVRAGQPEKGVAYLRLARDKATVRGQQELLAAIERDLKALEPR